MLRPRGNRITQGGIHTMPDRCVQCHQAYPEVDIGLLRVMHPAKGLQTGLPQMTHSRQQYCLACYRQAERRQNLLSLAKLLMALLPMMWFLFGGIFIYSGLYASPATAPIEVHMFYFGPSLAAFYAIPACIVKIVKRLDPMPETPAALPEAVEMGSR